MRSSESEKRCIKITGIPYKKSITNHGSLFYHEGVDDSFIRKKVKVIGEKEIYSSLREMSQD
jgi:hypothetical protein